VRHGGSKTARQKQDKVDIDLTLTELFIYAVLGCQNRALSARQIMLKTMSGRESAKTKHLLQSQKTAFKKPAQCITRKQGP